MTDEQSKRPILKLSKPRATQAPAAASVADISAEPPVVQTLSATGLKAFSWPDDTTKIDISRHAEPDASIGGQFRNPFRNASQTSRTGKDHTPAPVLHQYNPDAEPLEIDLTDGFIFDYSKGPYIGPFPTLYAKVERVPKDAPEIVFVVDPEPIVS